MRTLHRQGDATALQSVSTDARLRLVFEDDGETGYLYVLDHSEGDAQPIKDAVHLYNVDNSEVVEQLVSFGWSHDGRRCALFLGDMPVALVDFDKRLALSPSNFPQFSTWTQRARTQWSDEALRFFG